MAVNPPLRIAVLDNCLDPIVRTSFLSAINAAWIWTRITYPPAVQFFDATIPAGYPKPSDYDLFVLSGGTVDGIYDGEPQVTMQLLMAHSKTCDFISKVNDRFPDNKEFLDKFIEKLQWTRERGLPNEDSYGHLAPLFHNQPDLIRGLAGIIPLRLQYLEGLQYRGGKARSLWILDLISFVRKVLKEKRKLVGIGWGHQIICLSYKGGVVESMDSAELGRTHLYLTDRGAEMFPWFRIWGRYMWLHEFHNHEVTSAASWFKCWAAGLKGFVSSSNNVITIQGHPELNHDAVMAVLHATPEYKAANEEERAALSKKLEKRGDGTRFWEQILMWATE